MGIINSPSLNINTHLAELSLVFAKNMSGAVESNCTIEFKHDAFVAPIKDTNELLIKINFDEKISQNIITTENGFHTEDVYPSAFNGIMITTNLQPDEIKSDILYIVRDDEIKSLLTVKEFSKINSEMLSDYIKFMNKMKEHYTYQRMKIFEEFRNLISVETFLTKYEYIGTLK